jgi:predicted RNA-binding protein YlqC (UPF0109 family)
MNRCAARFSAVLEDLTEDETKGWACASHRDSQEVCVMEEAMQLASGDDSAKKMSDLVAELARALVDKPEDVSVETIQDGDGTLLRLHVAQSDVGKVIGKQGRTARSMRTVLGAASMKLKRRFSLDIVEETRAS